MNRKIKELNKENNLLDEKINEENQPVFTDMICYLRGSHINDYDIEIVRRDLTEMVLSAQERGENIQTVIGTNYKEFCDDIIASLPPKTKKQKLIEIVDIICWVSSILILINIAFSSDTVRILTSLLRGGTIDWSYGISAGDLLFAPFLIVEATYIVNRLVKNVFEEEKRHNKVKAFLKGMLFTLLLILVVMLEKKVLFTVNIFVVILLAALLFVAHLYLDNL